MNVKKALGTLSNLCEYCSNPKKTPTHTMEISNNFLSFALSEFIFDSISITLQLDHCRYNGLKKRKRKNLIFLFSRFQIENVNVVKGEEEENKSQVKSIDRSIELIINIYYPYCNSQFLFILFAIQ